MAGRIPSLSQAIDDVGSIRIFATVVECASFSEAARRLRMAPSTVSKKIAMLEQRLATALVRRTTRRLIVTEEGLRLYGHFVRILRELEEAEAEIVGETRPHGTLRVTAPAVLATRHFSRHIPRFLERYPEMRVEMTLTSQTLDLTSKGIDLAIRVADRIDPSLLALKLAPNRRVFCASADYIERFGAPQKPQELAAHNCLVAEGGGLNDHWPVRLDDGVGYIRVAGNLTSNNGELLRDACLGGVGIGMFPTFHVYQDIQAGRLREVLAGHKVVTTAIYAVIPHRRIMPRKTKAMIDFVKELFGPVPYWDEGALHDQEMAVTSRP